MNIKIPACKLEFPQNSFNIVVVRMNNKKRQLMVDKKYFYEKNCVVYTVPSEFIFASVVNFFERKPSLDNKSADKVFSITDHTDRFFLISSFFTLRKI